LFAQKQAEVSDYGYLLVVAMAASCAVLFAVIATIACVALVRRHRLRHHHGHHHQADSMPFQGHQCPHVCSTSLLGMLCAADSYSFNYIASQKKQVTFISRIAP